MNRALVGAAAPGAGPVSVTNNVTIPSIIVNESKDARATAEEVRNEFLELVRNTGNLFGPWAGS